MIYISITENFIPATGPFISITTSLSYFSSKVMLVIANSIAIYKEILQGPLSILFILVTMKKLPGLVIQSDLNLLMC